MLKLSALHNLLNQVLSLPHLHTSILLTREGRLVSTAHDPSRSKDEIKVIVGLCAEAWKDAKWREEGVMRESEYGRILVLPVKDTNEELTQDNAESVLLLALNSTSTVSWGDLRAKGSVLANHLANSLSRYKEYLAMPKLPPVRTPPASSYQQY